MKSGASKIPVYLISGFLGSGKTTLLKEIWIQNHAKKLVFLVNEFTARDVDASMLFRENAQVISVPGGSIFCTCLVTEFITRLKNILDDQYKNNVCPEGLVIEASGTANPAVFGNLLRDSGMERSFELRRHVCVTDPITLPLLMKSLPNIIHQIKAADWIVLNKTDLVSASVVTEITGVITELNPAARLTTTQYSRLELNPITAEGYIHESLQEESAHQPIKEYSRFSMRMQNLVTVSDLMALIEREAGNIFRFKGFIRDEHGVKKHVDYSISSGLLMDDIEDNAPLHLEFIFAENRGEIIRQRIKLLGRREEIN